MTPSGVIPRLARWRRENADNRRQATQAIKHPRGQPKRVGSDRISRPRYRDDGHPRRTGRPEAIARVLDRDTGFGLDVQLTSDGQVHVRRRLAAAFLLGRSGRGERAPEVCDVEYLVDE